MTVPGANIPGGKGAGCTMSPSGLLAMRWARPGSAACRRFYLDNAAVSPVDPESGDIWQGWERCPAFGGIRRIRFRAGHHIGHGDHAGRRRTIRARRGRRARRCVHGFAGRRLGLRLGLRRGRGDGVVRRRIGNALILAGIVRLLRRRRGLGRERSNGTNQQGEDTGLKVPAYELHRSS